MIFRPCFHGGHSGGLGGPAIGKGTLAGAKPVKGPDMLRAMVEYIWPKDNPEVKRRVLLALGLLVGAKLLNISVPFCFKYSIDYLNQLSGNKLNLDTPEETIATIVISLLVGYGLARAGAQGFNELRNAVFAKVAQHSIRKIAQNVFRHLHNLDLSFHLNRRTGALSKTIDRGSRGIASVLNAMVFNIMPTIFEMSLVTGILAVSCGPQFSLVALGAVGMYSVFTLSVTSWRTQFRLNMNKAENEAGNKAIGKKRFFFRSGSTFPFAHPTCFTSSEVSLLPDSGLQTK